MKKSIFILSSVLFVISCGGSGDGKTGAKDSVSTVSAQPSAESEKGLELIGASDCTTCHRLQQDGAGSPIGPAYSEVAKKYAPAADTTVDRLVKKIISGGQGVWGSVPMTPHPALAAADVKIMVNYILSLKK
jgi:cytochrome c